MQGTSPITDAVYPRRSTVRKPSRKPERRRVETLIGASLGEERVAELYRSLGFKRPNQRKRGQK